MLTDDRQPLPLHGCKACGTFGFVGPDRERCELCAGVGCVAGEPICTPRGFVPTTSSSSTSSTTSTTDST
jgi:hypothetical protein